MSKISPHDLKDIPYREADRALRRGPHRPLKMEPMNLKSPLYSFYCPLCSRFGTPITIHSVTSQTPVCNGGKQFL